MRPEVDEIIKALEHCNFDELSEYTFRDNILETFREQYKHSWYYETGASKLVIIPDAQNFVIKIPFEGYHPEAEWDDEECEYYECDFEHFYGADTDNEWDYCEVEATRYELSKTYGVEECFAKCQKVAEIDGYPIYMQEKAEMYNCLDTSKHTEEDKKSVSKICSENCYNCFNADWLSDVFNYFGEKIFYVFMQFLSDFNVNDLHSGNIGYINGRPVLIDYSGWGD